MRAFSLPVHRPFTCLGHSGQREGRSSTGSAPAWRYPLKQLDRILAPLLVVVLIGLGGYLWLRPAAPGLPAGAPGTATPPALATGHPSPTPAVVPTDSHGEDLADLPRYPGAVRVAFVRHQSAGLETTVIGYAAAGQLDEVRAFYRQAIDANLWTVGDVTYTDGRWTFLLIKGTREAIVEIVSAGPEVAISIKVSEPVGPASLPSVTSPGPTVSPQPTPPLDDDGADDDGADDDGVDGA